MHIGSELALLLLPLILGVKQLKIVTMEQVPVNSPGGMLSGDR
jgi:hypothetical protein